MEHWISTRYCILYRYSLIEHYRTHYMYIHCGGEWEKEIKCVHAFSLDLFGSAWFSWVEVIVESLLSVKMCCAHLFLDHWYLLVLLIVGISHRVYSCACSLHCMCQLICWVASFLDGLINTYSLTTFLAWFLINGMLRSIIKKKKEEDLTCPQTTW